MSLREIESPAELRAFIREREHSDAEANYRADYDVDAIAMVHKLVPQHNWHAAERDSWLGRIATSYGSASLRGVQMYDPLYILERSGLAHPVFFWIGAQIPVPPFDLYCASCQDSDRAAVRIGVEPIARPKFVRPVRIPRGVRVIEILLCSDCIERLDVEAS